MFMSLGWVLCFQIVCKCKITFYTFDIYNRYWKVVSVSYKIAKGKILANILLFLVVKDGF